MPLTITSPQTPEGGSSTRKTESAKADTSPDIAIAATRSSAPCSRTFHAAWSTAATSTRPMAAGSIGGGLLGPLAREHDQVADARRVGQEHQHPVDPHAEPAGRGHAVLQRSEEVLVEGVHLVAEHRLHLLLQLELGALLDRVGQLAERGDELQPTGHEVEMLGQPRVLPMRARER